VQSQGSAERGARRTVWCTASDRPSSSSSGFRLGGVGEAPVRTGGGRARLCGALHCSGAVIRWVAYVRRMSC
jgi:hypothetical protein